MKTLLALAFAALILAGCSPKKTVTPYEISGDIKNLQAEVIYLRVKKVAADGHVYWPKVDSAEVKDGKFLLNRDSSFAEPSSAMLIYLDKRSKKPTSVKFSSGNQTNTSDHFVMENTKISVAGDLYRVEGIPISGSRETDFLLKYDDQMFRKVLIVDLQIDSILKTESKAGLKNAQDKRDRLRKPMNEELKNVILAHKDLYGALNLLFNTQRSLTSVELEDLMKLLDDKLLQTTTAKALKQVIEAKKKRENS